MKDYSETGLDVLKKARIFRLLGAITTILIIIIYHNLFSEKLQKPEFFLILSISFFLLGTLTAEKSRRIRFKISQIEGAKNIKNPHEIVDFFNKSRNPELIQVKNKLISIYYESSFMLGVSIPFVLSMFTYFMKG